MVTVRAQASVRPSAPAGDAGSLPVYDSAERTSPVLGPLRNIWVYRGLLRLLVARDVTLRYKRSVLGVWWTLLNPLLTTLVMWMVFSSFFRIADARVPYVIYLLSGLVLVGLFQQAVPAAGRSVVDNAAVLTRVYVPGEIFALSGAIAAGVNFIVSVVALLIFQVALGQGIPWTLVLVPLPAIALLAMSIGVGLVISSVAVRFFDVLELTTVGITLMVYVTPVFYPESIVPDKYRFVVDANPLYHYLTVFRDLVYGGELPAWWQWLILAGSSVLALVAGLIVFARSWHRSTEML